VPPDVHTSVLPSWSVMLMIVLLKLAVMCACPWRMFLRSRRRPPFFLSAKPELLADA